MIAFKYVVITIFSPIIYTYPIMKRARKLNIIATACFLAAVAALFSQMFHTIPESLPIPERFIQYQRDWNWLGQNVSKHYHDSWVAGRRTNPQVLTHEYAMKYDNAWSKIYPKGSCFGCRFYKELAKYLEFETVLDAGAGNGMGVRLMRSLGKTAYGLELSKQVMQTSAEDLVSRGWLQAGTLSDIPFYNNTFDLIVSGDVLEHIEVGMESAVVGELVRVAKRYMVFSISLKSHGNEGLHTYLRSREWWEKMFVSHGARVHKSLWFMLQDTVHNVYPPITRESVYDCRTEGDELQGGTFECCMVHNQWLVGLGVPRDNRAVTTTNGELEPWIFAFEKNA